MTTLSKLAIYNTVAMPVYSQTYFHIFSLRVYIASVSVYQGGDEQLRVDRQLIIPYVNCSNSDGRITHITASLSLNNSGSEYPSFQVWRPMSGDPSVYERIGDEIVLEDSEVRTMDGYYLLVSRDSC